MPKPPPANPCEVVATDEFLEWWEGLPEKQHELRRKSGKHQLRVFYVFDETREAVVLVGGDKLGVGNKVFYETLVPLAESVWEQYLREQGRGRKKR